jgi:hypothetical protein
MYTKMKGLRRERTIIILPVYRRSPMNQENQVSGGSVTPT